jgi:hypothetical protein
MSEPVQIVVFIVAVVLIVTGIWALFLRRRNHD